MKKLLAALALVAIIPFTAQAQTALSVAFNTAKFSWDWAQGTGGPADGFRMHCGTATGVYTITGPDVGPAIREQLVSEVITAPGEYFCVVRAFNVAGESADSPEVQFEAVVEPGAPSNLRVGQ
jgi:hypothetical protein